jgi:hypothetical protein
MKRPNSIDDIRALIGAAEIASAFPSPDYPIADVDALVHHLAPAILRPPRLLSEALDRAWADESKRGAILEAARAYAEEVAEAESIAGSAPRRAQA